jgi:hypothetical protein
LEESPSGKPGFCGKTAEAETAVEFSLFAAPVSFATVAGGERFKKIPAPAFKLRLAGSTATVWMGATA